MRTHLEKNIWAQKDKLGWRVIYPIKNEDGSINWFNLITGGSWARLIIMLLVIAAVVGLTLSYRADVQSFVACCQKWVDSQAMLNSFG